MTSPPELINTALKAQSPTDEKLKPQAIIEHSNEKSNKSGDITTELNSPDRRFNSSPDRKSSIMKMADLTEVHPETEHSEFD